jgi:hypothetical protein
MWLKTDFHLRILCWPKTFDHQPTMIEIFLVTFLYGNERGDMSSVFGKPSTTHPHHRMATEIFGLPRWAWGGGRMFFFSKMILHGLPPPQTFWWPKYFSRHSTCPHHWMVTKRGGACVIILEKKIHAPLSFLGDWRISVTIWWCGCVEWWPKNLHCHPMVKVCWMVTKSF